MAKWDHIVWPEPSLQFKREIESSHPEPRYGLRNYGPLDFNTGRRVSDFIVRVGLLCKETDRDKILRFLEGLNREWDPEMKGSRVRYTGFESIYKARLQIPDKDDIITFTKEEIESVLKSAVPFDSILQLYKQKLEDYITTTRSESVLAFQIPSDFSEYFNYRRRDLRNEIKAICATKRLKTQLLIDETITTRYPCDNYWNLSIGFYVKAGGVPWKIAGTENYNCFIGVSFSIKKTEDEQYILIGLAEVFDEFGEHVTIEVVDCQGEKDEFFKSFDGYHIVDKKAEKLMEMALGGYKKKRNRLPEVTTVHKTTLFKENEKEGFLRGLSNQGNLVNIICNTNLKLIPDGGFPPKRGTYWEINPKNSLLYTTGIVAINRPNEYIFDETYLGIGTAHPLELNVDHDVTDIKTIAQDTLKLTKMNLNTTRLMAREPITIVLSKKVADILKTGVKPEGVLKDFRYYL